VQVILKIIITTIAYMKINGWKYRHKVDLFGLKIEIINDRTYAPVRFIAEALGKKVEWNERLNCVDIKD